ncbi:MAG TPA: glycosyltransferase [Flavisolibacter sp.]|nr:glycosyltransferase [Flavisolibacter sp.]
MRDQKNNTKKLIFTVTNDLNYDQRMIRICSSLQRAGFDVLLVGRKRKTSIQLQPQPFTQKRLSLFFEKGKAFYIEYNLRLLFYLLFKKFDLVCAIDLDTIVPCYLTSLLKRKKRVYDAHELFCEMKEIVSRPKIYSFWKRIEKHTVPHFQKGYTVNKPIRDIFERTYGVNYEVIMNVPFYIKTADQNPEGFIIYQGAVNEGRSFETLIPAFQWINYPLHIFGEGNFIDECHSLIKKYNVQDKVLLKGKVLPADLSSITPKALFGITLFENNGLNNYYSLSNRFFDYIQAGIPQLGVKYPAYQDINKEFEVALLIEDLSPTSIASAINELATNNALRMKLKENCLKAKEVYNWKNEEIKLVAFYQKVFQN